MLNQKLRAYQVVGIDVAMQLLRPNAKWEFTGGEGFTRWDDPRPCPSVEEVFETVEKLRALEDSINTIYLPGDQEKITERFEQIEAELEKD